MKKCAILAGVLSCAGAASAANVSITVTNMQAPGGFSFTPVWLAAHDGLFDGFDVGSPGNAAITALAEGGSTGLLSAALGGMDTTLAQPDGAPVFSPGESASTVLNVGDASVNRFLSFASMIVPSNDLFMGNDDPMAYEMFDMGGNFNGPFDILVYGADIWDNGSEVNNAFGDAAFSVNGGTRVDENGVVTSFFDDPDAGAYLLSFVGTGTADGGTIGETFDEGTLIARIRVVPAPGVMGGLALAGLAAARRRR